MGPWLSGAFFPDAPVEHGVGVAGHARKLGLEYRVRFVVEDQDSGWRFLWRVRRQKQLGEPLKSGHGACPFVSVGAILRQWRAVGKVYTTNCAGYVASIASAKAAVINLTTFCNSEFVNSGLRFSVVIPGEVDTPILDNRPIPPSAEARRGMAGAEEVGEAIAMIAGLPPRTNIPELIIRPTYHRDASAETSRFE